MEKISVVVIFLLCILLFPQALKYEDAPLIDDVFFESYREFPVKGHVELPIVFATFEGDEEIKMYFDSEQVTNLTAPSMFKMPDGQTIHEYIATNGMYDFKEYLESSVEKYFNDVTKSELTVDVVFYENPARPDDGLWILQPCSLYTSTGITLYNDLARDLFALVIKDYPDLAGSEDINYLLPSGLLSNEYDGLAGSQQFHWVDLEGDDQYEQLYRTVTFFEDNFNQSVLILVHEIAHNLMLLGDRGLVYCLK